MKQSIKKLHKAFESNTRLGIMSALAVNEYMEFNALKDLLAVTDGNLASHIKFLEKEDFIKVYKLFINRKPNTRYKITESGLGAFKQHISALEILIKQHK